MAENVAEFTVRGLDSEAECEDLVAELEDLEGVMGAAVDPAGEAAVRYDADILAEERVKITVRDLGYEVA